MVGNGSDDGSEVPTLGDEREEAVSTFFADFEFELERDLD